MNSIGKFIFLHKLFIFSFLSIFLIKTINNEPINNTWQNHKGPIPIRLYIKYLINPGILFPFPANISVYCAVINPEIQPYINIPKTDGNSILLARSFINSLLLLFLNE